MLITRGRRSTPQPSDGHGEWRSMMRAAWKNRQEAPMEPLLIILVPGLFGGLVLALAIARRQPRHSSTIVPRRLSAPSPALINMAHIQIEGVGGLGMVAVAVAVAVSDPRIRLALLVAAVLGAG